MSHLPRLHPDDLQEMSKSLVTALNETRAEVDAKSKVMQQYMTFSVDEVAKLVNVDPSTVRQFIKKKLIKPSRLGRTIRITQEALQDFYNNKPISHGK